MINERKVFNLLSLIVSALLVSSCGSMADLKEDNSIIEQEYGLFKGEISGVDEGSNIAVGWFKRDGEELTLYRTTSVSPDESFSFLATDADTDYTVMAFSDSNGDFAYQPGEEPAARLDNPHIYWARDQKVKGQIDLETLEAQPINLASEPELNYELDFSLEAILKIERFAENLLKPISLKDEKFSAENVKLGMWQLSSFIENIDYGLYVLEEYDPTKKSILLVHGINDSPRVFKSLVNANAIPDDYQLLLFHYPSAAPLRHTSDVLSNVLNGLVLRDEIPHLDILAHSMGGLVSKGAIDKSNEQLRSKMGLFISIASPYGGHAGAKWGTNWTTPECYRALVWYAMTPGSPYLQTIDKLDLSKRPKHHLIYTYSHERDGKREDDDGVVAVTSQLAESAQHNATAIYGIADNHVGAVGNPCTWDLLTAILKDGTTRASVPDCEFADASPDSPDTAPVD